MRVGPSGYASIRYSLHPDARSARGADPAVTPPVPCCDDVGETRRVAVGERLCFRNPITSSECDVTPSMTNSASCYMCDRPATSADHIPPKVFFPEERDLQIGMRSQRENLITVRSCEKHNGGFSADDEHAALVILTHCGNNTVASMAMRQKLARALRRRPSKRQWFKNVKEVTLPEGRTLFQSRIAVDRLTRVCVRIVRGLHMRDLKRRLAVELRAWYPDLRVATSGAVDRAATMAVDLFDTFRPIAGEFSNPETFQYGYTRPAEVNPPLYRLVFYQSFRVIVAPRFRGDVSCPTRSDSSSREDFSG